MYESESEQAKEVVYFMLKRCLRFVEAPSRKQSEPEPEPTSRVVRIDLERLRRRRLRLIEKTRCVAGQGERPVYRGPQWAQGCRPPKQFDGFLQTTERPSNDRSAAENPCVAGRQFQSPAQRFIRPLPVPIVEIPDGAHGRMRLGEIRIDLQRALRCLPRLAAALCAAARAVLKPSAMGNQDAPA